ncbi:Amino Acid/Auxin Permease (AAAP) Family [Thraustotheca clavata]|uniref:Amino Acid/Auxin Permease (AAAP) Family n=1 Tax=Thraustotheca clavata TaxID=74557 RepID=A0A1V9YU31_9STRA|nr:Amino Acid/Auxin Permease (AAAP) Family [Thraustotheca clavata]
MAFLTGEDIRISFSLFCCVYGIGTLGMPGNYAKAGYLWATLALLFMATVNVYATWCISQVMLIAPKHVKTFGDIGGWCMGGFGRWATLISQMAVCTMVPIVFLVLGGTLLTTLFPDSYEDTTWIMIMGLTLLPVCLVPTMKEGAGLAAAGCIGTLVADGFALYLLVTNMNKNNANNLSPPSPALSFDSVATVFGNLALAYGAGVVIPTLQREHSDPTRMPRIIVFTLTLVSFCFLLVSITGVSTVGCQIPGNLLFAVAGTSLGFHASRGGIILTFLCMQMHITIAFSVVMFPAFFIAERLLFGLHKTAHHEPPTSVAMAEGLYRDVEAGSKVDGMLEYIPEKDEADAYKAPGAYMKAAALRITMIIICIIIAIAEKDHFGDLLDFVGASSNAMCCMILPIMFYLKTFGRSISLAEKSFATICILVSLTLSIYVSVKTGKALFSATEANHGIVFPSCPPQYQKVVYTNTTYYKSH